MRKLLGARRVIQAVSAALFFVLAAAATGPVMDASPIPAGLYVLLDPAAAASAMIAARAFIAPALLSAATLLSAFALGRVFCGFICPMGTVLDAWRGIIGLAGRRRARELPDWAPRAKYAILCAILVLAVMGAQAYGWFGPISIMGRSGAFVLRPYVELGLRSAGVQPSWLAGWGLAGGEHPVYSWGFLSLAVLFALLGAEVLVPRFWCRAVCPLGALLGLASKFRLVRIGFRDSCSSCGVCAKVCPTGAIDPGAGVRDSECTMCMLCVAGCPSSSLGFRVSSPRPAADGVSPLPGRRDLLLSVLGGLLAAPMFNLRGLPRERADRTRYRYLLRPPGALPERGFLERCVRCGLCMRACPTNGLQPLLLERGLEAAFTPVLVPRTGCCELDCNACGTACPTGAVREIRTPKGALKPPAEAGPDEIEKANEKYSFRIGTAFIDRSRCIPWADGEPCSVCEEHCPTHDKAIRMHEVTAGPGPSAGRRIKVPHVVKTSCIGCGTCEFVCPLAGPAAIRVERFQRNVVSDRFAK